MNNLAEKPNFTLDPDSLKVNFDKNRFYAKLESSDIDAIINSKRRYVFRHYAIPVLKRLLTRYEEEEVTDAVPTKRLNEVLDRYVEIYKKAYRKGDEGIALFLRTVAEEYCESTDTQQYFVTLFLDLVSECFKVISQWDMKGIRYFNFAVEENSSHAVINIELI